MLAGHRQWLAVFLSMVEQKSLVFLKYGVCYLRRGCSPSFSAPGKKHFHVDAANSQSAVGEALDGKILEIALQKCSQGYGLPLMGLFIAFDIPGSRVFFIGPPNEAMLSLSEPKFMCQLRLCPSRFTPPPIRRTCSAQLSRSPLHGGSCSPTKNVIFKQESIPS